MNEFRKISRLAGALSFIIGLYGAGPWVGWARASVALVKDINTGVGSSDPAGLTDVDGVLFFTADDGISGRELWTSDGTTAGTRLVKDIRPGATSTFPDPSINPLETSLSSVAVDGKIYFTADDGSHRAGLWKSDGTEVGTAPVKNFAGSVLSSSLTQVTDVNGTLFFSASDGQSGEELWKSDGTDAGTFLVRDIRPGPDGSQPFELTNVNGTLFFAITNASGITELWKSDGTAPGTTLMRELAVPSPMLKSSGGLLYFSLSDGLWRSDGTASGTFRLKPGVISSNKTDVDGMLFFLGITPETGGELWRSDGTVDGTILLRDINPGPADGLLSHGLIAGGFVNLNGTLVFAANDGVNGLGLWKSDGTIAGTVLIMNPVPGLTANRSLLFEANGILYFLSQGQVWRVDGINEGAPHVKSVETLPTLYGNVTLVGSNLFFVRQDMTIGRELWAVHLSEAATSCAGDCDSSGSVTVDELLTGVNIALGDADATTCSAFDVNSDNTVTIDELLTGVNSALTGCS